MKALILAAGKSTRISSIAPAKPKPLIEILGSPVLIHNLKLLAQHGITDIRINLHYEPEQIKNIVGNGQDYGVKVQYSHETEILGTAGAVKNLSKEFSEQTFLVLYGDNFTNCNLTELLNQHKKSESSATIAVFDSSKVSNSGIAGGKIIIDESSRIQNFVEGESAQSIKSNFVNAGIYALEPEILNDIPAGFSDFGKDVFPVLLKKGLKLSAYKMEGFCLAVDTPESFQRAQQLASRI